MVSTRFVGFLALVLTNQLALGFRTRANLQHVRSRLLATRHMRISGPIIANSKGLSRTATQVFRNRTVLATSRMHSGGIPGRMDNTGLVAPMTDPFITLSMTTHKDG